MPHLVETSTSTWSVSSDARLLGLLFDDPPLHHAPLGVVHQGDVMSQLLHQLLSELLKRCSQRCRSVGFCSDGSDGMRKSAIRLQRSKRNLQSSMQLMQLMQLLSCLLELHYPLPIRLPAPPCSSMLPPLPHRHGQPNAATPAAPRETTPAPRRRRCCLIWRHPTREVLRSPTKTNRAQGRVERPATTHNAYLANPGPHMDP